MHLKKRKLMKVMVIMKDTISKQFSYLIHFLINMFLRNRKLTKVKKVMKAIKAEKVEKVEKAEKAKKVEIVMIVRIGKTLSSINNLLVKVHFRKIIPQWMSIQ